VCRHSIRRQRALATDLIETKRDHPQNNGESVSNRIYVRIRVALVSVRDREMWNIGK